MKITHIDHIGIVVNDLADAKEFFVDLGFTVVGEATLQSEFVDRVIGLNNVRSEIVMLQAPDGQINIELSKFHQPVDPNGIQPSSANTFGLRHLTFQVDDIDEVVESLTQKGRELVGELQTYENTYKLCYIHGPEGIIIELAEKL